MPKNEVNDPITDQEIAFAHLVLSGAMTDRQAAQAVGLNPDSAASTKAKPHVHAYMLGHRAAVQRPALDRQHVLDRLWEIANLNPEITRGSVTGQVKAIAIIVAMENFIPNRLAASAEKKSTPAPEIYVSEWRRKQQAATNNDPQPSPAPAQEEAAPESRPSQSTLVTPSNPSEAPVAPNVPEFVFVPDLRVPFSIKANPFAPRRR
jgi:hypothetical protein